MNTSVQKVGPASKSQIWRRPRFDTTEEVDGYRVEVVIPGVSSEHVELSIEKGVLRLIGRRGDSQPASWKPVNEQRPAGNYRLNLQLNLPIDESTIEATLKDGILELWLPKAADAKSRKISVS